MTAAGLTGAFAKAFDPISLGFVAVGLLAVTLMSFSFKELATALSHAAGGEAEDNALAKSIYIWETMARNAITIGVLGTILGLVLMLANMDDPTQLGPALSISFLTVVYGVILGIVCGVPAMLLHKRLKNKSTDTHDGSAVSTGKMSFETVLGYLMFMGLIIYGAGAGGLKDLGIFVDWPPLIVVAGGAVALILFIGSTGMGRAVTMSFAFTGLIGALMGLAQLLFHLNNPKGLGPAMAFIILSCFYAQLGMILAGFPMEDRANLMENNTTKLTVNRLAWYAFPLITLIFITLSIAILIFTFSNIILK